MEDLERSTAESEKWDIGVKDTLLQLLNKKTLQSKLSDLEGRSRHNNIQIYGVSENAEGSSMPRFIENLIKTELWDLLELNQGDDLGIERAHRALTPRPPAGMPPRSIVVGFLQFTTKEKILHAAWKKKILVEEKRVYFDHDYAEEVQQKRKEYTPIKRMLRDKQICFQTPLTKVHVHLDSGTVIYNKVFEAAEDLTKRGIVVGPIQPSKTAGVTEEDITVLLPLSVSRKRRGGKSPDFRQDVWET
ncbi:LINE-1 type transposase domain-containing 1 [Labeo rohita]|nr:LINE-1 type transposase domain-containing 1 [Labeo rohita]